MIDRYGLVWTIIIVVCVIIMTLALVKLAWGWTI